MCKESGHEAKQQNTGIESKEKKEKESKLLCTELRLYIDHA